ncbi:epimerase [Telluribacter sp.]|jgi:uncharacterized protein YbjT (DUF2867 family)|uniref:epimerase n=1 Tax=Telluribacter sp. TaxID=1978767 RepID=UPI002E15A9A4|nr:epimerase [Telluribacter sp.]
MKIRAIITGATGMVGKGVLLECLDDPRVESVLLVNRQLLEMTHPKLREVLVKDFFELSAIEADLTGYNACYFCLGVSSAGMSEAAYSRTTHDLTLHFATTLLTHSPDLTFCYVSGAGTDSSTQGSSMWARVKGHTENRLLALPFRAVYMFRPAFIQPQRGIRSKTRLYNLLYMVLAPLQPLISKYPRYYTTTSRMGQAMINVALNGYSKKVLESEDINKTSGEVSNN